MAWWCCCEGTNPSFAWIAWRARTAQLLVANFKLKWYPSECRNMLENLAKRPKMQRNLQLNRHSRRRDQPKEWWIDRFITSYIMIYWVHFRFGRFGDELLFGTQHVLNVHFGSRPKWTCKVQTQGLCFCDTRCVLVVRCPLNLVGVTRLSGATWSWLPL